MLESQLLSKVLDEKDFYTLNKYNISESDFTTEKGAYAFIRDYVRDNGDTPSVQTVALKFEDFEYIPETTDSFKYLCTSVKSKSAKRHMFDLLQTEAGQKFKDLDGIEFTKWLKGRVNILDRSATATTVLGVDFAKNGQERKDMYLQKKENENLAYIPTPYPTLTKLLNGGFEANGGYTLLMAFTNQGKSWIASDIGAAAFRSNYNVLHYSVELPKDQQLGRLDTLNGHFQNSKMSRGELENEHEYFDYLSKFDQTNEQTYIVKSMEDLPDGLTVETIETDLHTYPQTNVVIIDSFSLMKHKGRGVNDHNTLSQTSRELRQMFGRHNVSGIVIHQTNAQSERDKKKTDEVENVMVETPDLLSFSGSVSVIQDASCVLTFAQKKGVGKIAIEKARVPRAKGETIELHCDFDNGYIREVDASDFF